MPDIPEVAPDPYIPRVAVLVLLTFCCYGVQVLAAGQKRAEEEQKEFVVRTNSFAARAGWEPRSPTRSKTRLPSSTTSLFPCKRI